VGFKAKVTPRVREIYKVQEAPIIKAALKVESQILSKLEDWGLVKSPKENPDVDEG
jgi:hypothetical protein